MNSFAPSRIGEKKRRKKCGKKVQFSFQQDGICSAYTFKNRN